MPRIRIVLCVDSSRSWVIRATPDPHALPLCGAPVRWCHPLPASDATGAGIRCAQQQHVPSAHHQAEGITTVTDVFRSGDREQVVPCRKKPSRPLAIISTRLERALGPFQCVLRLLGRAWSLRRVLHGRLPEEPAPSTVPW
jgi:hypothetical protein